MQYINKEDKLSIGNSYSLDFLCDSFNEEDQCFIPKISSKEAYNSFSHKKYRYGEGLKDGRQGLVRLLLDEQDKHCCYCMARIEKRDVTLEHVIPESFEGLNANDEYNHYIGYAPILSENVELSEVFAQRTFTLKEEIRSLKKLPHLISYVNITASCHGVIKKNNGPSCFCNHPRGNSRIVPIMLLSEPLSLLEYNNEGSIVSKNPVDKEINSTINVLNLNHATLQEIRKLWYLVSNSNKAESDVLSLTVAKDRINLLKELFLTDDYTTLDEKWKKYAPLSNNINAQSIDAIYWDLFVKYNWFYKYYVSLRESTSFKARNVKNA